MIYKQWQKKQGLKHSLSSDAVLQKDMWKTESEK